MNQPTSQEPKPVCVRFAPSPTGFLHIGGARTALFNWLFAKANGGSFVLRIEDTDRKRNSPEAVAAILEGLEWLGLKWDGEPVSQYARAQRHQDVAHELLTRGHAYKCYLTPDELKAMREEAERAKRPFTVVSPWRDKPADEAPADAPYVVRLRAPNDGTTVVADHVQGDVTFPNKDLDDLILLRSDGSPTYNLAVVVDDHDMGITHVIRGVDHLSNAARQSLIFKLMDWPVPEWAHVPLIHGPDGAKLSKRHGALGVEAYRDMGYLPEALRNYLVRLGWSHGDDEIISTDQMISWFGLSGIGKSAARFDFAKLEALNGHYTRNAPDEELVAHIETLLPHLDGGDGMAARLDEGVREQLVRSMPGLKERAKTLVELVESAQYLFAERPLSLNKKAKKLLSETARENLAALLLSLKGLDAWSAQAIEGAVREFANAKDLKLGGIAQPLRAAVTGSNVSPPIFDVMAVLGREEALARIEDQTSAS